MAEKKIYHPFSCFNLDAISFLYIFALEIADTLRLIPCYPHLNK